MAYKLHGECGRLINLYDWMQSWISIVAKDRGDDEDEDDRAMRLQARFTQSVSSLQFLGFVRPSKRKTDHMQRLTW